MVASENVLRGRASYVHDLRPRLSATVFDRAPSRILFLLAYMALAATAIVAIAASWVSWWLVPLLSIAIGLSFAGMTFVAHELLHGSILRSRRWQLLGGFVGFLPFAVSPRLWVAWHNGAHHARTNLPDDPDGYPTVERYRARRSIRFAVDAFSLGGRRWRGALSLVLGFTVQSAHQLIMARSRGFLDARAHRRAIAETALALAAWGALAMVVGVVAFAFAFVLPLLVANACVMAFILTNHSLNRRVAINDPLATGLTVTTSRAVEWLTLGFGFHVEHHLFPAMSARHAPAVRALLEHLWPERYQSMPLRAALRCLHRTARVYKDDTTLIDPRTGREHATLPAPSQADAST